MHKYIIVILVILFSALFFGKSQAQSGDAMAVKAVIQSLFTGMEKSDSAMVAAAFTPTATMATVSRNKENQPALRRESSLLKFLTDVGTPHNDVWYEELWNMEIKVDGDLAQVWCDYAFYVGNTFSHCGVDAFHLFQGPNGWKIFHITYTYRQTPCNIPDNIKAKHQTH